MTTRNENAFFAETKPVFTTFRFLSSFPIPFPNSGSRFLLFPRAVRSRVERTLLIGFSLNSVRFQFTIYIGNGNERDFNYLLSLKDPLKEEEEELLHESE
jgi:hypothetical protein